MSENTKRRSPNGAPMRFILEVALRCSSDDCLTWPFNRPAGTYGKIRRGTVKLAAHRVVCEMAHGEPPTPGHHAAHTCGNGHLGCVNPHHLKWKTPSENNLDKLIHGTMANGARNGGAKLTEEQALRIRRREIGQVDAKRVFGISKTQYYSIARGDTWSHIQ